MGQNYFPRRHGHSSGPRPLAEPAKDPRRRAAAQGGPYPKGPKHPKLFRVSTLEAQNFYPNGPKYLTGYSGFLRLQIVTMILRRYFAFELGHLGLDLVGSCDHHNRCWALNSFPVPRRIGKYRHME